MAKNKAGPAVGGMGDLLSELKRELIAEVRAELHTELRAQVLSEIRGELKDQIKAQLKDQMRAEMLESVRSSLGAGTQPPTEPTPYRMPKLPKPREDMPPPSDELLNSESVCPNCDRCGTIREWFGVRAENGEWYSQSYCVKCRDEWARQYRAKRSARSLRAEGSRANNPSKRKLTS